MGLTDDYQLLEEMGLPENFICPTCKKPLLNYYMSGSRRTTKRGKVRKYFCLDCRHAVTIKDLDFRLWHNKKTILKFLKLRKKNISCYEIHRDNLIGIGIGLMTLYRWNKRFGFKLNQPRKNAM